MILKDIKPEGIFQEGHPMHEIPQHPRERALLVGVTSSTKQTAGVEEALDELALLADTAGADIIDRVIQVRRTLHPAYYIGVGKAEEIAEKCEMEDIDLVIFDDDLSPAQIKNLDKVIERRILDRSGLILDIFATRAKSKQAKLQVELAQLQYMMPRLTRQWDHLSRQEGGVASSSSGGAIGVRGPGETQLEVDRRLLRGRITHLTRSLNNLVDSYHRQRKRRSTMFCAALVGYTNAGKSTIFNGFTNANTLIEDRLFATLDSTTRVVNVTQGQPILLSDTVGFIRKLPHHLIASFKSTLTEVYDADVLIHVVDGSHPQFEEHITTVNNVLEDLGVNDMPSLMVFNKSDAIKSRDHVDQLLYEHSGAIAISALNLRDLERLRERMAEIVDDHRVELDLFIPHRDGKILSIIYDAGDVMIREDEPEGVRVSVRILPSVAGKMSKLLNKYIYRNLETVSQESESGSGLIL